MSGLVPEPWVVVATRPETHDVVTLDLAPSRGQAHAFAAAQINMLCLPGLGEVPISVSSDPATPAVQSHTIRASGPVTNALCALRVGDTVGVRGPYGTSWECATAEGGDVIVVGGGIGVAPLRSAVLTFVRRRERYGAVRVLMGARAPDDIVFRDDIGRWRDVGVDVRVIVDEADASWSGPVGLVTALLDDAPLRPDATTLFVCGPDPMMRASAERAIARGVPPERVRVTLERNMRCAVALCGHCQLGPLLVCRDGPVVTYDRLADYYDVAEV